jgi:DNA modification methylase
MSTETMYKNNNIELYCSDCLRILPTFKKGSVDVVFTSPPYNLKNKYNPNSKNIKKSKYYDFYDDNIDSKDFFTLLCEVTNYLLDITNKYIFINIQQKPTNRIDIHNYFGKYSKEIINVIIWNKRNPLPSSGNMIDGKFVPSITNAFEYIICLGNTLRPNNTYTKNVLTTNVNSNNEYSDIHRALCNIEVTDWIIKNFTTENDIILDPFGGLFSTGLSCLKYNRKFIGIELVPKYYEIGKKRLLSYNYRKNLFSF